MMLAVILATAVVIGVGVSFYLVRDVSSGIASIVAPMQALGKGDLSAEIPHQGDTTEIGAMADTLQVFKQELIAKKAADEAADAEAKIERGRRVDGITRNFETVIGEIVQMVSSASTQLEASASTLSATADRAREVTTTVAAASKLRCPERSFGQSGVDREAAHDRLCVTTQIICNCINVRSLPHLFP
jgi:methyl-accepting chemotaxis protein